MSKYKKTLFNFDNCFDKIHLLLSHVLCNHDGLDILLQIRLLSIPKVITNLINSDSIPVRIVSLKINTSSILNSFIL